MEAHRETGTGGEDAVRAWAVDTKLSVKTAELLIKDGFNTMGALALVDNDNDPARTAKVAV